MDIAGHGFSALCMERGRDPFPSSSGLSDVGVLLSKELLIDDGGWVPNLVGSVGWTSPTSRGSAFSPIPYVSGFQGGLTASKRLDPVVVFLGASYFSSASRDIALTQDNPSDVVGTSGRWLARDQSEHVSYDWLQHCLPYQSALHGLRRAQLGSCIEHR